MTTIFGERAGWKPKPGARYPLLVQTWPEQIPEWRSYSFCHYARQIPIVEHDARPVRDALLGTDLPGVLLIEWDIAFDGDDLRDICRRACEAPQAGFVCPYKLWPGPNWGHRILQTPPSAERWWHLDDNTAIRWVTPDDAVCNLPCFGAIYIPRTLLEAWEPPPPDPRLTDSNFALWSAARGLWWPIEWAVRPVHLHY